MLLINPSDLTVWYQGMRPPLNSIVKTRIHMKTFLGLKSRAVFERG